MPASATARVSTEPQLGVDRLSQRNFQRLSVYIYDYSGIKLPPSKLTMVEGRLRRRLRALQIASLDDYCAYVFEQGGLEQESVHLVNSLTTNKTDFFREPAHFDYIVQAALPGFMYQGRDRLKMWSSACSTGAEPYTLAMVMSDFLKDHDGVNYSILATDLSTDVLDVARRGVYPQEQLAPTPAPLRRKYVLESKDKAARLSRIAPSIRSKVAFARLNLMDDVYAVDRDMDIIFCRNVLIYFDKPTQQAVLSKLCDHLRPGGYLFLGHSESTTGLTLPLDQVTNTGFQRR